jgi:hypothetical protein
MASTALATRAPSSPPPTTGVHRVYYIDEGHHLRAIHTMRGPDGRYRPTGIEERVSFPIVQAALSRHLGRPELHPTELGYTELGAGAFRRKIKKAAKKIAQSKVLKKIAKGVKVVASFVPGASSVTASIDAAQMAAKGVRAVKKVVGKRSKVSGLPLEEIGAIKARLPAAAVARASSTLRASVKPTSAVATTAKGAMLREARLNEASRALALVPDAKKAAAAKIIASRVDGYKVGMPSGNVVWVSKAALAQAS